MGLGDILIFLSSLVVSSPFSPSLPIERGFLVKMGPTFQVAWSVNAGFASSDFHDLGSARQFMDKLGLRRATRTENTRFPCRTQRHVLENGDTVIQWIVADSAIVNRWTFREDSDANYFQDALENGGYSFSPQGHALLFVRH